MVRYRPSEINILLKKGLLTRRVMPCALTLGGHVIVGGVSVKKCFTYLANFENCPKCKDGVTMETYRSGTL